jgi:hypothetical protein
MFPFPCDACKGTGQRSWGHCKSCGGRGGFKSSPEQREATRQRRLALKHNGARAENMNQSVFIGVMNSTHDDALFIQMRVDHRQGRQWTPAQITTAREKLRGIREARRLLDDRHGPDAA